MKSTLSILAICLLTAGRLHGALPGAGTPENPYEISTVAHLQSMAADLNAHYVLMNDIDASDTVNWDVVGGVARGFNPVGDITWAQRFRGSLNRQGHIIYNLYINRPGQARVGLFGYIEEGAAVRDLGLVDVLVVGGQRTGALTGENHGWVTRVFSTGFVQGAWATGGLVGENHLSGVIEDAYSHATLQVTNYGGGLVGANQGSIRNVFSTGTVAGPTWATGGLIGQWSRGSIESAYWDIETSGLATSAAGEGMSTQELFDILTFSNLDIADPDHYDGHIWIIQPGASYPSFGWQYGGTPAGDDSTNPDDPEDPDEPADPEEPVDPEDPLDPDDPSDPSDPSDPEGPPARFRVRGERVVENSGGSLVVRARLVWEGEEDIGHPPRPYIIESTTDMANPQWTREAVIPRHKGLHSWVSPDPIDSVRKYYRVRIAGPQN